MILIIGGACQGKTAFAKKLRPDIEWADGAACGMEDIFSCKGLLHFHAYIRRRMEAGDLPADFAARLNRENPELVLVTDEIGYGIVPTDAFERRYRETTGRICTELAAGAGEVYRVICGIAEKIKG